MRRVLPMLALIVAVSACAAGQGKEKTNSTSKDKKATVAEGVRHDGRCDRTLRGSGARRCAFLIE
jgi:hypothetical protein